MTSAIILAMTSLHVDSRHMCAHHIDVSINTMKYLNELDNG
jgi:hypothetical protein